MLFRPNRSVMAATVLFTSLLYYFFRWIARGGDVIVQFWDSRMTERRKSMNAEGQSQVETAHFIGFEVVVRRKLSKQ